MTVYDKDFFFLHKCYFDKESQDIYSDVMSAWHYSVHYGLYFFILLEIRSCDTQTWRTL